MDLSIGPLTLLLTCKIRILRWCLRLPRDLTCLPETVCKEITGLLELCAFKRFSIIHSKTEIPVIKLILEAGFHNYHLLTKTTRNALHSFFRESYGVVDCIELVIRHTKCITDLDNRFLCSFLPYITDIYVINNIFILGVCFGRFELVQGCIENGAHDFHNARKAAHLFRQEIILYHLLQGLPEICPGQSMQNVEKRNKYNQMMQQHEDLHLYVFNYQHVAGCSWLKKVFSEPSPYGIETIKRHIMNLKAPMNRWGFLNFFQILSSQSISNVSRLWE